MRLIPHRAHPPVSAPDTSAETPPRSAGGVVSGTAPDTAPAPAPSRREARTGTTQPATPPASLPASLPLTSTATPPVDNAPDASRSPGSGVLAAVTAGVVATAVLALLVVFPAPGASAVERAGLATAVHVWAAPPTSINQVLGNLRGFIVGIAAGLATLFLSVGAVRYMWSGGDPGEIEKAKRAFHGAAIGYGVAVLAPLGVTVLQGIVGTG